MPECLSERSTLERILIVVIVCLLIILVVVAVTLGVLLANANGKPIQPDQRDVKVANNHQKTRDIHMRVRDIINPPQRQAKQHSNESTIESAVYLRQFLRNLTANVHPAGSDANLKVGQYIYDTWQSFGLENVHFANYENVLLDLPDYTNFNTIAVTDASTNTTAKVSLGYDNTTDTHEKWDSNARTWWNAYAKKGNVSGALVYANYGEIEDFRYLESVNINVAGKIVLVRYGGPWRGSKVYEAEKRGAIGVILFSDPFDYAPDQKAVYPDGLGLPGTGAQRGSLAQTDAGDPQTPFYPSKNYTYAYHSEEFLRSTIELPNIPVTPIGYNDAKTIFKCMRGSREGFANWTGGIPDVKYYLTSGEGITFNLVVNNIPEHAKIRNVIASVRGAVEPDSYVIVCNHYDAWSHGAVDPNSGTIAMLEMSRVLMKVINETGWRPRRSIIFAAWDAEEYGLIGSTEWVEENLKLLEQRGLATLNVDIAVKGGVTLQVDSVPLLYRVNVEAAKMVPNPNETFAKQFPTVYENWIQYEKPSSGSWDQSVPRMPVPSGGSDHASFLNYIGMPVSYITYQSDPNSRNNYFLYHSMFEVDWMVENLLDPYDFALHRAVTQFWLTATISLADSLVVPFNVSDYGWAMRGYITQLLKEIDLKTIVVGDATLLQSDLHWAAERFKTAADCLQQLIERCNSGDSVSLSMVEAINSRLKDLEKTFVNPRGLPEHPLRRHVVFAPSSQDLYSGVKFPSLSDSYGYFQDAKGNKTEQDKWKSQFNQEFTSVRYALESAIQMLSLDGLTNIG